MALEVMPFSRQRGDGRGDVENAVVPQERGI
jgi:hypothetical protein